MFRALFFLFSSFLIVSISSAQAKSIDMPPALISFCETQSSCGFMDITGRIIVPAKYDATQTIKNSRAAFRKDGLWGYMDKNAKTVIAPKYERVWDFTQRGFARVGKNNKFGIIDMSGDVVIPLHYNDIGHMKGPFTAFVDSSGKVGVIAESGKIVTAPKYNYMAPTGFGKPVKYRVNSETLYGKWGYVDAETGRELTPPIYDGADIFHNGLASVKILPEGTHTIVDAKQGMIDKEGNVVIPIIYDQAPILPEYDNVVAVGKGFVFSVFDLSGRHICDPAPEFYITQFINGRAKYRLKSSKKKRPPLRFGFLNENCKPVTERIYKSLSDYKNGIATFKRDGVVGYLNFEGEEIKTFSSYDSVGHFKNGLAVVGKNRKDGLMDEKYKIIVKPKYDYIFGTPGKIMLAKIKDRFYYITNEGKQIGPLREHPFPGGPFITPLGFCGKKYALNSQTGDPIGFNWSEFRKCKPKH